MLARLRESNREGMLAKLEHLDDRYLSKFFLGGNKSREVEMSEVCIAPPPPPPPRRLPARARAPGPTQ